MTAVIRTWVKVFTLFLLSVLFGTSSLSANVELIQRDGGSIANGSTGVTITIPTVVDDDKSMLIVTSAPSTGTTNGPTDTNVFSELLCSAGTCNQIRIERSGTSGQIDFRWVIVEFTPTSGVLVTRGTLNQSATGDFTGSYPMTSTVAVGATVGKSFALVNERITGTVTTEDDTIAAEILANGDLVVKVGFVKSTNTLKVAWQVVDYTDSIVTHGSLQLLDNTDTQTINVGSIDLDKTWLIYNYWNNTNTAQNADKLLVRGSLTSTSIIFDRDRVASNTFDVIGHYFLVEFTDDTIVQSGNMSFTSAQTTNTTTLNEQVNLECAVPTVGYHQRGGKAPTTDTNFAAGWFNAETTNNGSDITLTRGETGGVAAEAYWFVMEFDYCSPPINAVDDTSFPIISTSGGVVGDITANDTFDSIFNPDADIAITIINNGGLTGATVDSDGNLSIPSGTAEGNYTLTYQICDSLDLTNCDTAIVTVIVGDPPALDIVKTSSTSGTPVSVGDTIIYTVVVTNNTAMTMNNVLVTDTLPAGVTYVNGTAQKTYWYDNVISGSGVFNQDLGSIGFTNNTGITQSHTVTSTDIPFPGATLTSYQFSVDGSSTDWRSDISLLTTYPSGVAYEVDRGGDADTDEFGGNSAGSWNTVSRGPVAFSGTAFGDYTFVWYDAVNTTGNDNVVSSAEFIINYSYTSTSRVQVTDSAGTPPSLVIASDAISLAPGETMTVTFDVTVNGTSADLNNTASATADEMGSEEVTDWADDILNNVDLLVSKTLDTAGPYVPGQSIVYTVVVSNSGLGVATNVVVNDLPTNLKVTSATGAVASCTITDASPTLTTSVDCNITSLNAGDSEVITITATVGS